MNEAFEISGVWWLPDKQESKISGRLTFTPGDAPRLKLIGTFNNIEENPFAKLEFINPEFILGISSKGEEITLYKCLQEKQDINHKISGSYATSEFLAHVAFIGAHFTSYEKIIFSNLSVNFNNLDNWYNKNCIKITPPKNGPEKIYFRDPKSVVTEIGDFQIELRTTGNWEQKGNTVSIYATTRFNITPESQKSFDDFISLIRQIQNFLTFAASTPSFVTELSGEFIDGDKPIENNFQPIETVQVFYNPIGWQPITQKIFTNFMLLPYSKIEKDLPKLLKKWVAKSETLNPVYNLYFAGVYKSTYPENEFLNLAQALETYHRRNYGGKYQKDNIYIKGLYKTLLAAIPNNVDNDFKNSLEKGSLRYANEFSLRKRILLLTEQIARKIQITFLSNKEQQIVFAERIVNTRNYLTHYSPELKDKAITDGKGLFELIQQLGLLIKICLLEEIGFKQDEIIQALKRDRKTEVFVK